MLKPGLFSLAIGNKILDHRIANYAHHLELEQRKGIDQAAALCV